MEPSERILESRFAVDSDALPLPGLEQGVETILSHDAADNKTIKHRYKCSNYQTPKAKAQSHPQAIT